MFSERSRRGGDWQRGWARAIGILLLLASCRCAIAAGIAPSRILPQQIYFTHRLDVQRGSGVGGMTFRGFVGRVTGEFAEPNGLAFDSMGNLYFTNEDSQNYTLYRVTPQGAVTNLGLIHDQIYARASWSFDLAAGPGDEIYFSHREDVTRGSGISKIDKNGQIQAVVSGYAEPNGLAFDSRGNLYFSNEDNQNYTLYQVTPQGSVNNLGLIHDQSSGRASWSFDLAVSPTDEIYFTHRLDVNRGSGISKVDRDGKIKLVVNGFDEPNGLAFDHLGNLYFSNEDNQNYTLYQLTPEGDINNLGLIHDQTSGRILWSFDIAIPPPWRTTAPIMLTAAPPPVEVVSPNGGETLYGDTTIKIGWAADTAVAGTGVRHELWNGRGRVLNLNYAWDWRGIGLSEVYLPLVPEASDYRIRTVSLWDGGLEDSSDGPITVFGGAVRVHAPNGGETWRVGTRQFIHWQIGVETAGSGVHLELWDGSGRVATLASASDPDGENVTQIVVPQLPSGSDYRIRAVAAWGQGDYDESNSTFAIRGAGEGEGSSAGRDSWSWYE